MKKAVCAVVSFSTSLMLILMSLLFSTLLSAKSLEIAVGWTKPPYVIADGNTGFELDLVRAVFQSIGHEITPLYVPYGRSHAMLLADEVDVTLTLNNSLGIDEDRLSDVYVVYQNVALSLKKSRLTLDHISELQQHTVIAFQHASKVLGAEFKDAVKESRLYIELPDQRRQVEMLLMGHAAIAVMDINIFIHFSQQLMGEEQLSSVNIHSLFPPNPYRAGFKDRQLKESFNVALSKYMASDQFEWLKYRYKFY